jgi:hypothetical protein
MVEQGEPPTDKIAEEIAWEAEEGITRTARLAQEATMKRHNGRQDDLGLSGDGAGDGVPSEGHHPKYNW